jgi:hypothetical protein
VNATGIAVLGYCVDAFGVVAQAAPLIDAGLVQLDGEADLSVPPEVQQALAASGRSLKYI